MTEPRRTRRARRKEKRRRKKSEFYFVSSSPHLILRKHQINLAPVFGRARALAGPVGIVVQMIRHLRGPEATDIAIVQIALDRLAQSSGPASRVNLPPRREDQRTAHRIMRARRLRSLLKREEVAVFSGDVIFDSLRFTIDCSDVFHIAFLSNRYRER